MLAKAKILKRKNPEPIVIQDGPAGQNQLLPNPETSKGLSAAINHALAAVAKSGFRSENQDCSGFEPENRDNSGFEPENRDNSGFEPKNRDHSGLYPENPGIKPEIVDLESQSRSPSKCFIIKV